MTTPKERGERLNLMPYKCYHCEGLIGMHNHKELFIGPVGFPKSITIHCMYCDRFTFWKPSTEILK